MAIAEPELQTETVADLLERLGGVPASRVLLRPSPGTATVDDVVRLAHSAKKRLCELVDGVLVEKAMGFLESQLAMTLGRIIGTWVFDRRLGIVTGEQGMIRPLPDQVRMPDVAFYRQDKFPNGTPLEPAPELAPDLAIEVISPSNTAGEMERKRRDLFQAGMRLFWEINPRSRTAVVWTAVDHSTNLSENDSLDGGDVLPGFSVRLADLFAEFQPKPR